MKQARRRKEIFLTGLFDDNGVWSEEFHDIEDICTVYFSIIFSSTIPSEEHFDAVLQFVDPAASAECNESLLKPFTKEEIHDALLQKHPCKAPGPNGMHAIFYQRFWHINFDDVTSFISSIIHGSLSPNCVNHTNIALVP